MKLVADALEGDRRATCKELFRATGAKTSQGNTQEPTSVARDWLLILSNNARPHTADVITKKTSRFFLWEMLPHASYSPDMSPLLPKVRRTYS